MLIVKFGLLVIKIVTIIITYTTKYFFFLSLFCDIDLLIDILLYTLLLIWGLNIGFFITSLKGFFTRLNLEFIFFLFEYFYLYYLIKL